MKISALAYFVLATVLPASAVLGQQIYSTQGRTIMVTASQPGGQPRQFFQAKGIWVLEMKVARLGSPVGILSAEYRNVVIDSSKEARAQVIAPILEIVDSSGKRLWEGATGVQRFSFSPSGREVAFVTGERRLEGSDFVPKKLGIVDLESGAIRWIRGNDAAPGEVGTGVYWAADDTLVANDRAGNIVRIDLKTLKATAAGVKGPLDVSPDGRYNLLNAAASAKERYIEVVDLTAHENISPDIYQLVGESLDRSDYRWGLIAAWLGDSGSLLGVNLGERTLVIDVAGRKVLFDKRTTDLSFDISGGAAQPSFWLVRKRGVFVAFDRSALLSK